MKKGRKYLSVLLVVTALMFIATTSGAAMLEQTSASVMQVSKEMEVNSTDMLAMVISLMALGLTFVAYDMRKLIRR